MMHTQPPVAFLLACWIALFTARVSADEPFGVKLLRPDCLAGWDHGEQPPRGWTVADGRLVGSRDSTPLLSGFTAGDSEVRFGWSVAGGGAWKIMMPEVPAGSGLELILREADNCGQLIDGQRTLAPGGKVEPLDGKMHTAAVRRAGGKLSLKVDDRQLWEVDVEAGRRFALGLAVIDGEATLDDLRGWEPPGEPIFNGNDLAGWWCPGNADAWAAEGGELVLRGVGGDYLRTEKEYGNFTLSLEFVMRKHGNSGIGLRTPRAGWPSGDGMELQLEDRPGINGSVTMAIYRNVPPLARADKSEEYNQVVVKADGWMISAWVNGELVQQCNTFHHPELKHRNLKGWIGLQDHGAWIRVRNLRLLEAPDGAGLDAWRKSRPPGAVAAVLDRILNPQRLSVADGITSGIAGGVVAGENQDGHVLAELTGPGAVVRVARSNGDGQLALYFDGEEKPRIECKPEDLWKSVPGVAEDSNPVLTLLAYRKSLKVVLRGADSAEYRFDYVGFPDGLPIETFSGTTSDFPPGWLAVVDYRHSHFKWGVHRECDPVPRFSSQQKTIEPGKTEPLVHVDGAGIVRWVKLRAGKGVLGGNDLWLEATIDGEDSPAVSAPARLWFPALAGGGNYHNFVLVDRGGVTNVLAMPFAGGFTLSAKNCGGQPIPDVGATISVEQATDQTREEVAGRMRLRGIFQPAGDGNNELIHRDGSGRWVAFVYQSPGGEPTGIDALLIDGEPVDGWSAANLDSLLGRGGDDFRACLSGRHGGLCWRYLMLAPVDFQKSMVLKANRNAIGARLGLFYMKK